MSCSDDEGETVYDTVSNYYFCNEENEPLSFSDLPVQWNERERSNGSKDQIFLSGHADGGLHKLYKQVIVWKYDLSKSELEISVLSKDNNWIKLQKPRKSYENEIRKIMITLHCLHFVRTTPEAPWKALWEHLSKVNSSYDHLSKNDLMVHFIREAVKRDKRIAKSEFLATLLDKNHRNWKVLGEDAQITKPSFVVDDMDEEPEDDDSTTKDEDTDSDEEEDVFDSVCAICDNGGSLACCEGKCLRSFHATLESGEDANAHCESLGIPAELLEGTQPFFCENCKHNQHQCYVCGELGSSDRSSSAEVFQCSSATCGHFYHPNCVVPLLCEQSGAEPNDLKKKIAAGEPFTCPAHKCCVCKTGENVKQKDNQFAICRRCPRSYHRKCLPREIIFYEDDVEGVTFRAWEDLLPQSRVLIYCLDHDIIDDLCTPSRNLKFPGTGHERRQPSQPVSNKKELSGKERHLSERTSDKRSVPKLQKAGKSVSAVKGVDSSRKRGLISPGLETSKKQKVGETSKKPLKRKLSTRVETPINDDGKQSLGGQLYELMQETINKGNQAVNSKKDGMSKSKQTIAKPLRMERDSLPPVDECSKRRILSLMEEATSSITLEEVKKKHIEKAPSTHAHTSGIDKSINVGVVEKNVEAVRLALSRIEGGCSTDDAMAICEPHVIEQLMRWKDKLKLYLMPFLHGMRYTSYGRHFTKPEKLELIVDRLCQYAKDGDTIVDFCCGANDFSRIMNKRLEEMGIKCNYKNYDFRTAKHDFNFVKKDWMTVSPKELPSGSKLIMGLNPPFGKNCALANKFIEKALEFKPKLLVLIVPPATRRLDSLDRRKHSPYDLVWEDNRLLDGMAFYLPGSVDINDKQIDQWNNIAPLLSLWSRPDWSSEHKSIARKHGHAYGVQQVSHSDGALDLPTEDQDVKNQVIEVPALLDRPPTVKEERPERTTQATANQSRGHKEDGCDVGSAGGKEKFVQEDNRSNEKSKKRARGKGKSRRGFRECLQVEKHDKKSSPPHHTTSHEILHSGSQFAKDNGKLHDQSMYESNSRYDRAHARIHEDDVEERFDTNPEEQYHAAYGRQTEAHRASPMYGQRRMVASQEHYMGPSHVTPNYGTRMGEHVQFQGYQTQNFENNGYGRGPPYMGETSPTYGMGIQGGGYVGHRHYEPGMISSGYGPVETSTMKRYEPRLDELNPHARANHMGPPPLVGGAMGVYNQHVPGPGFGADSLSGFAPGPYRSYPQHGSSGGWIDH